MVGCAVCSSRVVHHGCCRILFVANRPGLGASVRRDAYSLHVLCRLTPGALPLTFVTVHVAIGLLPSCPATMCDRAAPTRNHGAIPPPSARRALSSSRTRVFVVPRDVRDRMAEIMRSAPAANMVPQGGASQDLSPDSSVGGDEVHFVRSVRPDVPTSPLACERSGLCFGVTSLRPATYTGASSSRRGYTGSGALARRTAESYLNVACIIYRDQRPASGRECRVVLGLMFAHTPTPARQACNKLNEHDALAYIVNQCVCFALVECAHIV